MNFDKATIELMDKRPGKVSKLIPIRKRFCVDRDRAALAYAIWLNGKLGEPDAALIKEQRAELLSMANRSYARELSNTMGKALRLANDTSREVNGKSTTWATQAVWDAIKAKMTNEEG